MDEKKRGLAELLQKVHTRSYVATNYIPNTSEDSAIWSNLSKPIHIDFYRLNHGDFDTQSQFLQALNQLFAINQINWGCPITGCLLM